MSFFFLLSNQVPCLIVTPCRVLHTISTSDSMSDEDEYLSEESYEFEFEDDEDVETSKSISNSQDSAVCMSNRLSLVHTNH